MGLLARLLEWIYPATTKEVEFELPETGTQGETVDAAVGAWYEPTGYGDPDETVENVVRRVSAHVEATSVEAESSTTTTYPRTVLVDEPNEFGFRDPATVGGSIPIPAVAPPSAIANRGLSTWLVVEVELNHGNRTERSELAIEPGGEVLTVHEAATDDLGLRVNRVELEDLDGAPDDEDEHAPEIEYYARDGAAVDLEELDVRLLGAEDGLWVEFEVETPDGDERRERATLSDATVEGVASRIRSLM